MTAVVAEPATYPEDTEVSPYQTSSRDATGLSNTHGSDAPLLDPLLTLASITLDDLERLRIAQENRYRSLTQSGTSESGQEWGFGLDDRDPNVAAAGAIVDQIKAMEHQATLHLQKLMRKHPLGPWVKAQKGVGEKQAARLLGVIGDPYINSATGHPRTVSQLWAYCGLHTLPATDQYNVAARRKKGVQANWNDDAKKRVWLIANSILKAGGPWREVYDRRKAATEGRVHQAECVRCGPSGKPAQPGSPWSDGHRHADALRIMGKELLKGLWRESRRLHQSA
ncbi:hypothetical protein [Nesterenkonia rhizosphaerae]|uniref:DUF222 domain-containing protein n=1 Tax=Nesterenkonia rhizosphaerae TaxID=1348272 RepID=A0ABP9G339_9MICC